MARVVIFGTGDYAEVARLHLERESDHEVVGFTAEKAYLPGDRFQGLPTFAFETLQDEVPASEASMLVATGPGRVNKVRARFHREAKEKGYELITHVSPNAAVWEGTPIGENSFIFEGVVLEAGSSVGADSVLWSGALVAHHTRIGNHCFLAPRVAVSGRAVVEDYCFLGINATVRDHVRIARGCVIGAGAIIKKDTEPGAVYSARGTELYLDDSSSVKL